MGNHKARKDAALPHYVGRVKAKNRVIWREYLGGRTFGRVVTLLGDDDRPLSANAGHREIMAAYNRQVTQTTTHNLRWLVNEYLASGHFAKRAKTTQKAYRVHAESICSHATKNGKTLGDAPLRALTPPIFSKYRDSRSATAAISANRELQFIRAVFNWGIEYGKCATNPAKGVRLNPSQSRDRYITDEEMALVQSCGSMNLALVMEFAYLLRARIGEVLALTVSDLTDTGVMLRRTKGSDSELTLWSDRLREAVDKCRAMPSRRPLNWLIHDKDGGQVKYGAIRAAFVKALARAKPLGLHEIFTIHDLKAKGITDHKTHHGGHRSARMADVYIRKPDEVESTR